MDKVNKMQEEYNERMKIRKKTGKIASKHYVCFPVNRPKKFDGSKKEEL